MVRKYFTVFFEYSYINQLLIYPRLPGNCGGTAVSGDGRGRTFAK